MDPERLGGWLELTWALGSLGRLEEAEVAARSAVERSQDPSTLGNLGAVLFQQHRLDDAREVAQRAIAADPQDRTNQSLLAAIEHAAQG